ncbi:conserved hypothetical protein [Culex quinquefasciatus]|uniref:Uncharacterized protein n=1 Tax=Culex quinquefasciatus TaxID=7176 RepID=B0W7D9_CULQU|nr:conserved hypothetical protein [Culex quinquefasciatus]|eukprot:XP_001844623.1 conserved hypothetical protein [Culex quinquefasciatus]
MPKSLASFCRLCLTKTASKVPVFGGDQENVTNLLALIELSLWQTKHENGFLDKLTRLIKATLDGVMCHVRVSAELAEPFWMPSRACFSGTSGTLLDHVEGHGKVMAYPVRFLT